MIIDKLLELVIPYITSSLELIGVVIIVIGAIGALINIVRNKFEFKGNIYKVSFAQAMSLSLEFKLASEIIKTVVIRSLDEFVILAAVAILRVVITIVLHWELKSARIDSKDSKNS